MENAQVGRRSARSCSHSRKAGSPDPAGTADTQGSTHVQAYATARHPHVHRPGPPQREEKGATAVEYGLMVGLIAAVIITTVVLLGNQLNACSR